jgi:hypothetical protein
MIPKPRSLRVPRNPIGLLILLAAAAAAAGCSNANTSGDGAVNHVDASGNSVPGWVTSTGGAHANSATMNYIANGGSSSCTECHGSDLAGGISRVSCFGNTANCHHGSIPNWSTPAVHGAAAKKAPGTSGFASCQICHGADFRTVRGGITCFTCHVSTPHAPAPWRGSTFTHANTDNTNAPVCAQCHFTDSPNNPPNHPATPAPAGTAPGCFNNTLCHGENPVPHNTGSTWLNAGTGFHGTGAKSDLTNCQGCHGTPGTINFNGGSAPTACSTCHAASQAHPTDWQGLRTINGVTITHRTSGNRDVACAICHNTTGPGTGPNPSAPSCFSASFTNALGQARACHSGGPGSAPHALGATWLLPTTGGSAFHGTTAKADLLFCQECHGTPPRGFGGGTGGTTACTTCHATAEAHPTDWQGVRAISTASITHRTSGNRDAACGVCHNVTAPGAGPNPAAPSCFSSTHTNGGGQTRPCHPGGPGAAQHPADWGLSTQHGPAAKAAPSASGGFSYCQECHGTGTTPPANFGGGTSGPSCYTCHTVNAPHPAGATWVNSTPPTHQTTNTGNATVCAQCHPEISATTGCFNNNQCHI